MRWKDVIVQKCLAAWNIPPAKREEWVRADAIVTQAVSWMRDGGAGPGNWLLAGAVRKVQEDIRNISGKMLPVIPQEEVWMADQYLPNVVGVAGGTLGKTSSVKRNTYSVAKFQAGICRQFGFDTIVVVTFDLHMRRAMETYRLFGLEPLAGPVVDKNYTHRNFIHWGMRTRWRAFCREFILRHISLVLVRYLQWRDRKKGEEQ